MIQLLLSLLAVFGFSQVLEPGQCMSYRDEMGVPMVVCLDEISATDPIEPTECSIRVYWFPPMSNNYYGGGIIERNFIVKEEDRVPRLICQDTDPISLDVTSFTKERFWITALPVQFR